MHISIENFLRVFKFKQLFLQGLTVTVLLSLLTVLMGFLLAFLLAIAVAIGGLWGLVPKITAGEEVLANLLALIIVEASSVMFAVIFYKFFLKDYIKDLMGKHRE